MNRVVPCTIKFNNYLLIMIKKTNTEKIDTYEQLVKKLKSAEVSPQEAWNLIEKIKLKIPAKTIWKLDRFHQYLVLRIIAFANERENIEKDPKIKKLIKTSSADDYLKAIKKFLPKRVTTIRELVKTPEYQIKFKKFHKGKKMDERAEIKNLEKLIVDSRQLPYWDVKLINMIEETKSRVEGRKPMNFDTLPAEKVLKFLR